MTREEQTISNLKKLKSFHNGSYGTDIDRAIKALEQEPISCQSCKHLNEDTEICLECEYDGTTRGMTKYEEQKPCEDAIRRESVLDLCDSKDPDYKVIHFKEDVECLPPVNPQPKGHWISHYDEGEKVGWYECDHCHTERAFNTKFCPDCGYRMVEPQESEEICG